MSTPHDQERDRVITQSRVDIARLEANFSHLIKGMEMLTEKTENLTAKIDEMESTLNQARGGWRTMMLVGGAGATVAGGIGWLLSHLKGLP